MSSIDTMASLLRRSALWQVSGPAVHKVAPEPHVAGFSNPQKMHLAPFVSAAPRPHHPSLGSPLHHNLVEGNLSLFPPVLHWTKTD